MNLKILFLLPLLVGCSSASVKQASSSSDRKPSGVTEFHCRSSNGNFDLVFADELAVEQYIPVDGQLVTVTHKGAPATGANKGLVVFVRKPLHQTIDFTIFEPSDSYQDFNLLVKGSTYEFSRIFAENNRVMIEKGQMNCKRSNP